MIMMHDILFGMAVGDAVGVPYEFKSRAQMEATPCTDMIGHGVHGQPKGTWSDDTSMALCMVESLIPKWDLNDMADKFVDWFRKAHWTPHGRVFDMGNTTMNAIVEYERGNLPPNCCGGTSVNSNGNGSVMRILPISKYFIDKDVDNSIHRYKMVSDLSSITHGHQISVMSCFILTEIGRYILNNRERMSKDSLIKFAIDNFLSEYHSIKDNIHHDPIIMDEFLNLWDHKFEEIDIKDISGSGYCVHTVIAAVYCVLTTDNYKDAVLKAVNLGLDTDTTACVTGGLAAMVYGSDDIPKDWISSLARYDDIYDLACGYENTNTIYDRGR